MEEKIMNTTEDVIMEAEKINEVSSEKTCNIGYVFAGFALGVGINVGAALLKKAWLSYKNKKQELEDVVSEDDIIKEDIIEIDSEEDNEK